MTECGVSYEHDWQLYRTERGKIKACDGKLVEKKRKK